MRSRLRLSWFILAVIASFMLSVKFIFRSDNLDDMYVRTTRQDSMVPVSFGPFKHATKSLAELGSMDELRAHVLFFNRVPKSGSEMLLLLIQWLQGWNSFRHVRLKDDGKKTLSRLEQEAFVEAVYEAIKKEAVPLCFDRQIYFLNFTSFDKQSPTFINLIRDPIDNFVARYQFLQTTASPLDIFANKVIENKLPIEKCIQLKNPECTFKEHQSYDLTIPYFCGQDSRCTLYNSDWALQQAKSNVARYYPVVGILEEVNVTLSVFELTLPYFFKGVQKLYYRDLLEPFHNRKNKHPKVTDFVRKHLRKRLHKEYEFYEWVKSRLFNQLRKIERKQSF